MSNTTDSNRVAEAFMTCMLRHIRNVYEEPQEDDWVSVETPDYYGISPSQEDDWVSVEAPDYYGISPSQEDDWNSPI